LCLGNLFRFLDDENRIVNHTNNALEGGINSPLRMQINRHRGMRFINQQRLVELYLLKRSEFWNKISQFFTTLLER
jgi:hypothetical protein